MVHFDIMVTSDFRFSQGQEKQTFLSSTEKNPTSLSR